MFVVFFCGVFLHIFCVVLGLTPRLQTDVLKKIINKNEASISCSMKFQTILTRVKKPVLVLEQTLTTVE